MNLWRPDASKDGEWSFLTEGEPDGLARAIGQNLIFREACEGDSRRGFEPRLPIPIHIFTRDALASSLANSLAIASGGAPPCCVALEPHGVVTVTMW